MVGAGGRSVAETRWGLGERARRLLQVAAVALGCGRSGGGRQKETPAFGGEGVQPRRRTVALLFFLFFSPVTPPLSSSPSRFSLCFSLYVPSVFFPPLPLTVLLFSSFRFFHAPCPSASKLPLISLFSLPVYAPAAISVLGAS